MLDFRQLPDEFAVLQQPRALDFVVELAAESGWCGMLGAAARAHVSLGLDEMIVVAYLLLDLQDVKGASIATQFILHKIIM